MSRMREHGQRGEAPRKALEAPVSSADRRPSSILLLEMQAAALCALCH